MFIFVSETIRLKRRRQRKFSNIDQVSKEE